MSDRSFDSLIGHDAYTLLSIFSETEDSDLLQEIAELLADSVGVEVFEYNFWQEGSNTMNSELASYDLISVITMGFAVLLATISMISAFITVLSDISSRKREFETLAALGMTKGELKSILYRESVYYGVKVLIWGGVLSFPFSWLIYIDINKNTPLNYIFPWLGLASYIVCLVAILFSVISAAKVTPKPHTV